MKKSILKLLSVILAAMLCIMSVAVVAHADGNNTDTEQPAVSPQEKLSPTLAERLKTLSDDDVLSVVIFISSTKLSEAYSLHQTVIEKLGVKDEDVIFLEHGVSHSAMKLTKSQINSAILLDEVNHISEYDMSSEDPSPAGKMSEKLKEVLAERSPDEEINVAVWVKSDIKPIDTMPSWPDREKAMAEMKAVIADDISAFLNTIPEDIEYESSSMKLTPMVFLTIKAKNVERLANLDKAVSIDYVPANVPISSPTEDIIADRFKAYMAANGIVAPDNDNPMNPFKYKDYAELAAHEGNWTLIRAHVTMVEPWSVVLSKVIGDTVLSWWTPGAGQFPFGLFVYDAAQDKFFPIEEVKPENYDGLNEAIKALKLGRPLGDADGDGELTVLDATMIQRDIAQLDKLPVNDKYYPDHSDGRSYADADLSGEVDILDATRIQRKIAHLD